MCYLNDIKQHLANKSVFIISNFYFCTKCFIMYVIMEMYICNLIKITVHVKKPHSYLVFLYNGNV